MKMQKRQFRIGQLAEQLGVEKFVIRFWEKEFEMKTSRSSGGQRFYSQEDVDKFFVIKDLLYTKGFTIAGAKQQLHLKESKPHVSMQEAKILGSHKTTMELPENSIEEIAHKILELRKKLVRLRETL